MGKQNWRVRASQPVIKLVCGYPVVSHRVMFYVLVIVRKSSCTRYNGTRGGVEIVIQYEAQPSTVWSIETRHECHYIQYSLISVL